MNYLRKLNMVCLSRFELESMFKTAKQKEILSAIQSNGLSLEDLHNNKSKMEEIVDSIIRSHSNDKDEIEIFFALFSHLNMYSEDSEVCFILKDTLDPRKINIETFEQLKSSIKENHITDFAINSEDGLRQFQLKQYKGEMDTNDLFNFIQIKLIHYGNDLGNTNMLIILQPKEKEGSINFEELSEKVKSIGVKSDCEILVSYNENDTHSVINRLYPSLATIRKERNNDFKWYSQGI